MTAPLFQACILAAGLCGPAAPLGACLDAVEAEGGLDVAACVEVRQTPWQRAGTDALMMRQRMGRDYGSLECVRPGMWT